jgi:hypothetical protein
MAHEKGSGKQRYKPQGDKDVIDERQGEPCHSIFYQLNLTIGDHLGDEADTAGENNDKYHDKSNYLIS